MYTNNTKKIDWTRKISYSYTSLRTSESAAEDTNVIASPFVPNLPALPTCPHDMVD